MKTRARLLRRAALAAFLLPLPLHAAPRLWSARASFSRTSDTNLNRLATDSIVDARSGLGDVYWDTAVSLRLVPITWGRKVRTNASYDYADQRYENRSEFNFRAHTLTAKIEPERLRRVQPSLSGSFTFFSGLERDFSGRSGSLSAGLEVRRWGLSAIRAGFSLNKSSLSGSDDRDADGLGANLFLLQVVRKRNSVFGGYAFRLNDANGPDFSYLQHQWSAGVLLRPRDWLGTTLRYRLRRRSYRNFDSRFGVRRRDTLHVVSLRAEVRFVEDLLSSFLSYERQWNLSNAALKDFTDRLFSLGLQVRY